MAKSLRLTHNRLHEEPTDETDVHRIELRHPRRPTRALEAAGVERKHAEAHAEQLRAAAGADLDQLATKDDLEKAVTRLEGSHALLKWMVGFTLAFVVGPDGPNVHIWTS